MADVANVYAAMPKASGALAYAPLGSDLPTDATTALDAAFVDGGYIGEDGFTESIQRDTTKKKAFGGSTVKVLQTDFTATVTFRFLESLNADVLKAVWGDDNVTVDAGKITVKKNKATLPHMSWVIDTIDGDASLRSVIPNGQIISTGDVQIVHTDTIEYEVTIECFEDEDGNNILTYTDVPSTP